MRYSTEHGQLQSVPGKEQKVRDVDFSGALQSNNTYVQLKNEE